MSSHRHTEDASLFARASAWVARLEAPDCTPAERESFEDWLAEDPAHVKAWRRPKIFSSRARAWLRTHGCGRLRRVRHGLPDAAGCLLRPRPLASAWPSAWAGW